MKLKKLIPTLFIPLTLAFGSCDRPLFYEAEYVTPKGDTFDLSMRIKQMSKNEDSLIGEVYFGVRSNSANARILSKGYITKDTLDIRMDNFLLFGVANQNLREYLQIDSLENLYRFAIEKGIKK